MAQLSDKVVLISGATSGIGEASACSLAKMSAHVILHGRNDLKCQSAIERIKEECPNASLDFITAELSSITDVRLACESLKNQYHKLDVLINNAGSFYLSHHLSLDGIEMTAAINHIAHFVLTVSVMGLLLESQDARIINVSSNAHVGVKLNLDSFEANKVKRVNGFQAYAQSKI